MLPSLIVVTGASGAGKTSLAKRIAARDPGHFEVLYFDSVGVPAIEDMIAIYGSGEQWQRATTIEWMQTIRPILGRKPILFEGQMRIAFIQEALAEYPSGSWKIVLVDCDDATRLSRLSIDRAQPELANAEMTNWAQYLRNEALQHKIEILDTGRKSLDASAAELLTLAGRGKQATR